MKKGAFKIFLIIIFLMPLFGLSQKIEVKKIDGFNNELEEISGLVYLSSDSLLAINDSGNDPIIYLINTQAEIIKKTYIINAKNKDWEDLALDQKRNLYIADIGNNTNKRKKLFILKVNLNKVLNHDSVEVEKIQFYYPEQKAYPPNITEKYFDAESLWADRDYLYIMTKNKTEPCDGISFFYRLPQNPGKYPAEKLGEYSTCTNTIQCWITAADFDPASNTIVLLTTKELHFISYLNGEIKVKNIIRIPGIKQRESICFGKNDKELFMADEFNKILRGNHLYKIQVDD